MNAEEIRQLNTLGQQALLDTKKPMEHEVGLKSLLLSVLTELTAQVAEMNEHLAKIANPPMLVVNQEKVNFNMEEEDNGRPRAR